MRFKDESLNLSGQGVSICVLMKSILWLIRLHTSKDWCSMTSKWFWCHSLLV